MSATLRPFVRFDSVLAVQRRLRCRPLDLWFQYFPLLGNELQYVLLLPFLTWCCGEGGRRLGRQYALAAFAACALSNTVKERLQLPRPPAKLHAHNSDVERVGEQYGFPSTHTAHALSQAWLIGRFAVAAGMVSQSQAIAIGAFHIAHVCLSRLYLGVHSAADLIGGLTVGGCTIGAFAYLLESLDASAMALAAREPLYGSAGVAAACLLPIIFLCACESHPPAHPPSRTPLETLRSTDAALVPCTRHITMQHVPRRHRQLCRV